MAAAVFEALFYGNDEYDFEPDPGAVVIWFSDDPSLNEQSRFRLMEASDKLTIANLVTVENTFSREKFEPGKIYFLNTQKLSKNSILVRGHDAFETSQATLDGRRLMPDLRSHTIWETIQNTVDDEHLTLYLVLDEAHRGMGGESKAGDSRPTIVKQLINGHQASKGVPIVWGISATVARFNEAMKSMENRATLPNVVVDSTLVQASGLLKDTINLDIPSETGNISTVLLKRGTEKLQALTRAWQSYAAEQGLTEAVTPLMVLQVPNSPRSEEIGEWLETIFSAWPELPRESVCNVFGEHRTERFGKFEVPYVAPERIQESSWVRVVVAKDAISTGWDCPRAEVMVSFRPAQDRTHITQLIGRMIRTPLARRIPGNDLLNAVDCLLPYFDRAAVEAVVHALMTGDSPEEALPGRRVLINPVEVKPNPSVPEAVWSKLRSLPSEVVPRGEPRPVKRLTALAHELAADGLVADAGKLAHGELHKILDKSAAIHEAKLRQARAAVLEVEGEAVVVDVATGATSFQEFVEASDYAVIEDAYRRAGRALTADLTRTYSEYLAEHANHEDGDDAALQEAHIHVAALGLVPEVQTDVEKAAEDFAIKWLHEYVNEISKLSDERQDVYRQLRELSNQPMNVDLAAPKSWLQPTSVMNPSGKVETIQTFERHLLCDQTGKFPEYFTSSWEGQVVAKELKGEAVVGWYRNPARATPDSLGITYLDDGSHKTMRPDFLFFAIDPDGKVAVDIVDPHGHHFADALPKLQGLARYAEEHGSRFRRIASVAELDGTLKVLNLQNPQVRQSIATATSARSLYAGGLAEDYASANPVVE